MDTDCELPETDKIVSDIFGAVYEYVAMKLLLAETVCLICLGLRLM